MSRMRPIEEIHVHCADTPADMDVDVARIRSWHLERGWKDIGYNIVITNHAETQLGRPLHITPASILHHNNGALAICCAGGRAGRVNERLFADGVLEELDKILHMFVVAFPNIERIVGHYQYDPKKTCPNFDVPEFLKKNGLEEYIYERY